MCFKYIWYLTTVLFFIKSWTITYYERMDWGSRFKEGQYPLFVCPVLRIFNVGKATAIPNVR